MATTARANTAGGSFAIANDFDTALVVIPGIEAMRAAANFAMRAQNQLRTCEYQELMQAVHDAGSLLPKKRNQEGQYEWPEEAREIGNKMEEILKDYDTLAGGFRQFVENGHTATMAVNRC
ncbi:hypothetical protein NM208_g9900 [Fusarium decemcellulare]|uniref:Uncharacterized protein n=1 Tax=Fusarium decemcellulare TaxID=57161 RepID=A0ACC1S0C3_9HYPO|nr:hypothetical protein NM208_g9900 [Fusarium decemcellulare]